MPIIKSPTPTLLMILICVAVAIMTRLGTVDDATLKLMISEYRYVPGYRFTEILDGQVWRLITPIFLHFSLMHIVFNMIWFYDLGGQIEKRIGYVMYLVLVLVIAIASNLLQYVLEGPSFGGMSGVVYGLFGYMFMRIRAEGPGVYFLLRNNVFIMFGWFVLCWTGLLGPVANWAHTGGLALGMLLGWIGYGAPRVRQVRRWP
ncbi:rhomboid family intramembrane serine protease [Methylovirgula sp. 4M-Z18]|uniref:rhomboid family intramembrane serine protease n=1 Tax=Methylovirgula sp. 4M-Z18 TaxID=2293567 RepID=UPI001314C7B3|nr:rhomboid family intramembrane serine protease [Methylovirgula sp. 4M-Z18]